MTHFQPDFKPVYILGAGASRMLGAPLVNDFLSCARQLRYSPKFSEQSNLAETFDRVFNYQGNLLRTRKFVNIDLDNIETLFSTLDMDWQVTSANANNNLGLDFHDYSTDELKNIREALFTLIIETLRKVVRREDNRYNGLIQFLAQPRGACFITFNYDTSIETALSNRESNDRWRSYTVRYGNAMENDVDPTWSRNVLKLHGSANWTYCDECKRFTRHQDYITPLELDSNRHLLHDITKCKNQKALNVILPPTWYKFNYLDEITNIWSYSIQEISLATHLFIIGYSFPRTDMFFDQLLTLGFRGSKNLKKVVIINPSMEVEEMMRGFFDGHFIRDNVLFIPTKFEILDEQMRAFSQPNDEKVTDALIESLKKLFAKAKK